MNLSGRSQKSPAVEEEEEDEGIKAMKMDWIMASRVWAPNEGMQIQERIIVVVSVFGQCQRFRGVGRGLGFCFSFA